MSNTVVILIKEQLNFLEGLVTINGLKPTKLTKKNGETTFATLSALIQAANAFGKRTGLNIQIEYRSKPTLKKVNKEMTV